jgi:haloalkane dehalogenase
MAVYRRPYLRPGEDRRPTLSWPRQVPVAGQPPEVAEVVERYAAWLAESPVPKLFVEAVPGVMFESHRAVARAWPHQQHVTVPASHVVPEDVPDELGAVIAAWLRKLP